MECGKYAYWLSLLPFGWQLFRVNWAFRHFVDISPYEEYLCLLTVFQNSERN
jgi:hypothetical protein